jgi:hypothetical protein
MYLPEHEGSPMRCWESAIRDRQKSSHSKLPAVRRSPSSSPSSATSRSSQATVTTRNGSRGRNILSRTKGLRAETPTRTLAKTAIAPSAPSTYFAKARLSEARRPSRRCTFKMKFTNVIVGILFNKRENRFAFRHAKPLAIHYQTVEPRSKRRCAPREQDICVCIERRVQGLLVLLKQTPQP